MGGFRREIVVTLDREAGGRRAYETLRSGRHPLAMTYLDSLDERLANADESGRLARELGYQFVLLGTEGDADDLAERTMRWFGTFERPEDREFASRGHVVMAESNRLMQFGTAPAGVSAVPAGIGAPLTFGGQHTQYLGQLNVAAAHRAGVTGSGIRVAVVDSGIDSGTGIAFSPVSFYDVTCGSPTSPAAPADSDGHGTAMAQIINAVAPDAEICGVRVVAAGQPKLFDTMTGMAVALLECAADIVNVSLSLAVSGTCPQCGGSRASTLTYFTQALTAAPGPLSRTRGGVVIVAAGGNTGTSAGLRHPAACDGVVAVGAVNRHATRSSFSTHGTTKRRYLMAPGGEESSPLVVTEHVGHGSAGPTAWCYGTSPACAYAAGLFALVWSEPVNQNADADQLIDTVLNGYCSIPGHVPPPNRSEYGAGVIAY